MPDALPPPEPIVVKDLFALAQQRVLPPLADPPGADLFARVARERGLRPPSGLFDHVAWNRYARQVYAAYPPWGWCPHYVAELARGHLPRICGAIGLGPLLGCVSEDPADAHAFGIAVPEAEEALLWSWRWLVAHAPRIGAGDPLLPLAGEGEGLAFRLAPGGDAPLLILDRISGEWVCPALDREGVSLIELMAWRLEISHARAASRIARLCGVARPVP